MRILSLDLGIQSCGICVSDETNTIPIPLENFLFPREDYLQLLIKLETIIKQYKISLILLGYPLRTDGKKSESTIRVEKFNELLINHIDSKIKVKYFNESFSTKRGIKMLQTSIKDPKKIKELKDVAAAYIILKDYLMIV